MKNLLILCLFISLISCGGDRFTEKNYCGTIINKGYEEPTSGYKSHRDPCYYVLLKVDSINTVIRINVTVPTYYRLNNGDRTCFLLTGLDLQSYGNTSDDHHLIK
jgi:hypothetical protein